MSRYPTDDILVGGPAHGRPAPTGQRPNVLVVAVEPKPAETIEPWADAHPITPAMEAYAYELVHFTDGATRYFYERPR